MTRWQNVADAAAEIGIKETLLRQRLRRICAAPHTRVGPDETLQVDVDWFDSDHKRILEKGFGPKSPAERIRVERQTQSRVDRKRRLAGQMRPITEHASNPFEDSFDDLAFDDLDRPIETSQNFVSPLPADHCLPARIGAEPSVFVDYLDERRKWAAKIEQIKFRKMAVEIVSREAVTREAFEVARLARDQMLAIPDRVSGLLAGETSQDKIFKILDGEIRRVLSDLCDQIEKIEIDDSVEITDPIPKEESVND